MELYDNSCEEAFKKDQIFFSFTTPGGDVPVSSALAVQFVPLLPLMLRSLPSAYHLPFAPSREK